MKLITEINESIEYIAEAKEDGGKDFYQGSVYAG